MSTAQTTAIPLLDLKPQYHRIREEILAEVTALFESQRFILGAPVEELEREIAAYTGSSHAVGCASGSDAILLALRAHGIGPGDEVLTVPYTFFATGGYIHHCGATPVFVDVDEATFNLDVIQLAEGLDSHPKVRAIMPVHLFGGCADMDPIKALARERGIAVIEDAAQAIGAEYNGKRAGSLGDSGCFSFFPSKNLGAFGDGGMVTTSDTGVVENLLSLRMHGSRRKYHHDTIGYNSRLDALQAAVLKVKLRHLDLWTADRIRNADLYRRLFADAAVPVTVPQAASYQTRHVYNQFVIRCPKRDQLRTFLAGQGIGTEVYYPVPLHLQPCFSHLGHKRGAFPVSERLADETLALPVHAELEPADIAAVVDAIRGFYA